MTKGEVIISKAKKKNAIKIKAIYRVAFLVLLTTKYSII